LLKERTQALEDEAYARKRVAEERDALQQRIEHLSRQLAARATGAIEEEMQTELNEYKVGWINGHSWVCLTYIAP
jgi:hypothetical protein